MSDVLSKAIRFAYESSDLHSLGMAIEKRNKKMMEDLNSEEKNFNSFGIGCHFNNVGYLIRNAADKVMKNGKTV